jgi:hypothetical protein
MATLFGRDVKTIGKHVNNALHEELANVPTVANFAIVQKEENRTVTRNVDYYSIDMIMSGRSEGQVIHLLISHYMGFSRRDRCLGMRLL